MPGQTQKSGIMTALGNDAKKAVAASRKQETVYPTGGGLPAGIESGIARLTDIGFAKYKKGENIGKFFFSASAVVITPETHDGMIVKGKHTRIQPEPMCATPKASKKKLVKDHIDFVTNLFRQLGLDTADFPDDDLDAMAAALKEAAPYFTFRTWKGTKQTTGPYAGKEPRVNEVWERVIPDYVEEGGSGDDVVDESGGGDETPPDEEATSDSEEGRESEGDGLSENEAADLDTIIASANEGNEDAQRELQALAEANGVGDECAAADDWDAAGEIVKAAITGESEPEAEYEPTKGDVVFYKPLDPKTKKPFKKGVQCEVTAVNKKAKKVDLKNLTNTKLVYKQVAFDALSDKA